jgi:type IV secretion system protein VirB1
VGHIGAASNGHRRVALASLFGAGLASCVAIASGQAAPLSRPEFSALAVRCAPGVSSQTLEAVALTESGLDPWALHDNSSGLSDHPASFKAALSEAESWLGQGHSVDLGLMQINSANLAALGMTVSSALDLCVSMAGGAAVLRAAYGTGGTSLTPADQQVALLMALSRYNTGSPLRGILNGYARRVMATATSGGVQPLQAAAAGSAAGAPFSNALIPDPNAPPAWNVGAVGVYAQVHGAPWLVALRPVPSSHTPSQSRNPR